METEKAEDIRNEIIDALDNTENLSQEELRKVYCRALAFCKKLPREKRGAFFWESGVEMLAMLVDGFDYENRAKVSKEHQ